MECKKTCSPGLVVTNWRTATSRLAGGGEADTRNPGRSNDVRKHWGFLSWGIDLDCHWGNSSTLPPRGFMYTTTPLDRAPRFPPLLRLDLPGLTRGRFGALRLAATHPSAFATVHPCGARQLGCIEPRRRAPAIPQQCLHTQTLCRLES